MVSPEPPVSLPGPTAVPEGVRNLALGNPDIQLLPRFGPALSKLDPPRRVYGEELKDPGLVALSRRQLEADGIQAAHLTVVSGALDGLERVMLAHLRPGDRVAVEDPAFSGVLALLQPLGLVPIGVEIDAFGLLPEALGEVLDKGVRAVIATPRAQNPTGAALDARRSRALRRVLRDHPDTLVMEDDHAGPISGVAAETLGGVTRHWALARSHSKALGPDLRVAVLAGDEETIGRVEGRQLISMRWVSHVLQQLVVSLWSSAEVRRSMRSTARIYAKRREALIDALGAKSIGAMGRSGLNVWIPVPEEAAIVSGLIERGWAVAGGERFRLKSGPAIRVTTATLEPTDAKNLADDLAELLVPSSRTYAT
jgi:DNA-binding transcriptional MocR family regulator